MLVCSRSIPEVTNSIIKSFSVDMSTQTSKTKLKKKKNFTMFYLFLTWYKDNMIK